MINPFALWSLYRRSRAASRYAAERTAPGMAFHDFGTAVGRRLLSRGDARGLAYLLTPISIVRYFEFPFALSAVPPQTHNCLDVASPRLFSLYVANEKPSCHIDVINPDERDIEETRAVIRRLNLTNLAARVQAIETMATSMPHYDCIWSLSVIEHVAGEGADAAALQRIFSLLQPGGRLIVTVPVDRRFRIEYRDEDHYGTAGARTPDGYFFQRYYDKQTLQQLLQPLQREPRLMRWFGERVAGHFQAYEQRWSREGFGCTVDDAREIVDYYQEYPSWEAMPGVGVCGLVIEK